MKIKRPISAAVLLLTAGAAAVASPLTPEKALERAMRDAPARIASRDKGSYRLAATRMAGDAPGLYVYEKNGGEGFLVVTADDNFSPVAGYGNEGSLLDKAGNIAPECEYWLGELSRQMEYASTGEKQMRKPLGIVRPEREPIAPLCTTRWNQREPYNYFCPKVRGEKSVTGCVATAMSQVMKYFNWPECGEGSHSYTCSAGAQSQDYSTIRYSWTDMLDEYDDTATKRQQMAVGQLMYGAGVSVDMNYGTHASGAAAIRIPIALTSYFRYDRSMQYLERDYYLLSEWEQLIYDNLKSYGPVIYDGVGGQGGHSFVCDGYSSDGYFHFNWGWGGVSDGYFLLDLLDPIEQGIGGGESAFSYMQDCVLGIRPDRTGESVANPVLRMNQPLLTDVSEVSRQDEINWGGFVYNPGPCATGEGVVGLCFYGVSEDECHYLPIGFFDALEPMYGFGDLTAEIPEDIPDGRYEVKAVYQFGSEEDYAEERFVDVEVPLTGIRGILAEISGDEVTLSEIGPDLPTLLAFEYPETLASDEKARISARLANESGQAVFTVVVPILIGEDGTLAAYGSFTPIDLAAGEETGYDVETLLAAPRGRLPQGDYELHLCGYGAPYFFSLGDGVPIMITAPAMGVEEVEAGEERSAMSYGLGGLPARSSDRIVIKVAGNGVGEKVAGAPF